MDETLLQQSRRRRLRVFLILALLAGAKLGWSLFQTQVLRHEAFVSRAQSQQERRIAIPARRGAVYDRNGVPLAVNRERYFLYLVPDHVRDPRAFLEALTELVPVSRETLRAKLARGGFYVPLLRTSDREMVKRLERAALAGVGVERSHERYYPHGGLAASVLGQVDLDNRGIAGLELQYDGVLRGRPGWAVHQRDALGREYANFAFPMAQPVDGSDVTLTLDLGLQEIAEEALEQAMTETRSRTGSLIVADPWTGEILALANRPDADPNAVRGSIKNHALVDVFEPGSTFKIVTLAGLYEEKIARPDEEIFCENGSYHFANRRKPIRDVHPYGTLTVEDVIGKSSNICTIKLAQRLGNDRIFEYARRFGFGLPTGMDFPGESRGLLRLPRDWSALSIYSIAMGYEVSVSAIQLTMMFAAIANGGELLQPYLVRRVAGPDGELFRREGPRRVRRVISRATADLVTRALVRVVQEGTGTAADLEILQVAGKSGTARKTNEGSRGYTSDRFNSTFGGFFPAESPRFVIFVRLDDPRGAYYGGLVAGPVFKKAIETTLFADKLPVEPAFFDRIRKPQQVVRLAARRAVGPEVATGPAPLPPRADGTLAAASLEWSDATSGGSSTHVSGATPDAASSQASDASSGEWFSAAAAEIGPGQAPLVPAGAVKVPDFTAMSLREALVVASQRGLDLAYSGPGVVVGQEPEPGEIVSLGSVVRVRNAGHR